MTLLNYFTLHRQRAHGLYHFILMKEAIASEHLKIFLLPWLAMPSLNFSHHLFIFLSNVAIQINEFWIHISIAGSRFKIASNMVKNNNREENKSIKFINILIPYDLYLFISQILLKLNQWNLSYLILTSTWFWNICRSIQMHGFLRQIKRMVLEIATCRVWAVLHNINYKIFFHTKAISSNSVGFHHLKNNWVEKIKLSIQFVLEIH